MKYYYKNNQIHAFNDLQIRQGLANGLTELTPEELDVHLNPPPEPEPIPESITMRQCRLQLLQVDLLDTVELAVVQDKAMQIEWEYAAVVERSSLVLQAIQGLLELSNEQIDNMFLSASKL